MTTTHHSNGLRAESHPAGDEVLITQQSSVFKLEKDVIIAIAAAHAARWPEPKLGQSVYRSVDAHLIAQQDVTRGALDEALRLRAENERLRRALQHVKALGDAATHVAGTPLSLYATAALNGATE